MLRTCWYVLTQRRVRRSAPLLLDWAQMEAEEGAADRARELLNRAVKVLSRSLRHSVTPALDRLRWTKFEELWPCGRMRWQLCEVSVNT